MVDGVTEVAEAKANIINYIGLPKKVVSHTPPMLRPERYICPPHFAGYGMVQSVKKPYLGKLLRPPEV
jgi:hypothetical protein